MHFHILPFYLFDCLDCEKIVTLNTNCNWLEITPNTFVGWLEHFCFCCCLFILIHFLITFSTKFSLVRFTPKHKWHWTKTLTFCSSLNFPSNLKWKHLQFFAPTSFCPPFFGWTTNFDWIERKIYSGFKNV